MLYSQFPPFELEIIFSMLIPTVKRRKFFALSAYLIFIFYFSVPAFNIPWISVSSVRLTSLMEQRALENFLIYFPEQCWVRIEDINPNLLKAIISIEDGKFFSHRGIDWKELKTSLRLNKRRGRAIRGGSTITMQLSKNLFLSTRKSVFRKAKEFIITFRIEKEISKKSILETYANVIEWGDGTFGICAASKKYFNKEPKDLSLTECSKLAAVIPSPLRHDPAASSNYVNRRAAIIRSRLNDIQLFLEN